ncbi:MAG: hypothetical protein QM581_11500, partial [Pseudomonas sp.]
MQPDELKAAWHQLGLHIERQQALQRQWLGERRRERMRGSLRPLYWGQLLQLVLGVALVLLGIACWKRNLDVPGYFAAGVVLHAFGVATTALAGITLALVARIDYAAPVLCIEKQLATLRRFYVFNGMLAGWPWWVMWIVVAVAGLAPLPAPGWIWASLAVGALGWIGTGWLHRWSRD